jgi:tripartite-type tricarboxylate transporter receptor subunit TctC
LADLLGGHVQMSFDPLPSSLSNIKSGKLRALAVTTLSRSPSLSDVPTISESGIPGYELNGWSGLLVPAGTPARVVNFLNSHIVKILQMPDVKSRFTSMAFEVIGNTPEEFQRFIEREVDKWGKVVRSANISAD